VIIVVWTSWTGMLGVISLYLMQDIIIPRLCWMADGLTIF